jgi:hypothetical protein
MTLSDVLDRASFDNGSADAEKRFVPSTTFAQHRAPPFREVTEERRRT